MQPLMHASKSWGRQGGSSGQAMMHASKSWGRQEVPQVQLLMHSFDSKVAWNDWELLIDAITAPEPECFFAIGQRQCHVFLMGQGGIIFLESLNFCCFLFCEKRTTSQNVPL